MKKQIGKIEALVPLYLILFIIVVALYVHEKYRFNAAGAITDDALVAANLAAAVIDVTEYGESGNLIIASPNNAYLIYQEALKANMGLDENWRGINSTSVISGQVEIVDFVIYNVRDIDIEIYSFGQNPYSTVVEGGLGSIHAPNGQLIENTSIYSSITFPVDAVFGVTIQANKRKLVDITD